MQRGRESGIAVKIGDEDDDGPNLAYRNYVSLLSLSLSPDFHLKSSDF